MNPTSKSGLTDKFRPPKTKICRVCEQEKPIKDFARNVRGRSGYANECRACKTAQDHQRKDEQKEQAKTFFDAKFFTLFLLLSVSLTAFSQSIPLDDMAPNTTQYIVGKNGDGDTLRYHVRLEDRIKPDTLRAKLLVTYTTRRWGVAHARDGFVVIRAGEMVAFFTDKMECFPPETELWKWREANKKKIK